MDVTLLRYFADRLKNTSTFFQLGSSYPASKLNCGGQLIRKKARAQWPIACYL